MDIMSDPFLSKAVPLLGVLVVAWIIVKAINVTRRSSGGN